MYSVHYTFLYKRYCILKVWDSKPLLKHFFVKKVMLNWSNLGRCRLLHSQRCVLYFFESIFFSCKNVSGYKVWLVRGCMDGIMNVLQAPQEVKHQLWRFILYAKSRQDMLRSRVILTQQRISKSPGSTSKCLCVCMCVSPVAQLCRLKDSFDVDFAQMLKDIRIDKKTHMHIRQSL